MGQKIDNNLESCVIKEYAGGNRTDNYILMLQDYEREFIVTHNANIKPVAYFTGREIELQDLRQRIEDGRKSVLVSGMGGIGKTHICRKLFEEYLEKNAKDKQMPFRHIGYIEYNGDMDSSLQNCLKFKVQESLEQNQEAAWRELEHLASDGKLLLFVDNVDKPISDDLGLQRLRNIPGAVILTSRQTSIGDEFEPYRIGFLSIEQCREIYEKIRFDNSGREVNLEDTQDLEYIIDQLAGRHTITVVFLAHLARTKHWTVKRLRAELEQKGFRLEFHKNGELINLQQTYEVLYDLSTLTEAEQNILEAFSLFPYIPLEVEICNQWLLADAGVGETDDILMGLYQKGWLQFDTEQEGYDLHPVFAQYIYNKKKPSIEAHHGLVKACKKCICMKENSPILEWQKFVFYAENISRKLDMEENDEQADFLSTIGCFQCYIAEYNKAEELYEKCLQIDKKVFGNEHINTARTYHNLAMAYEYQGKYEKAENLFAESIRITEKVLGNEHLETAFCYQAMAGIYSSQRKYPNAEELYIKSMQISEKEVGREHPDTALIYNNLAEIYTYQGKYIRAEELDKKCLQIFKKEFGENNLIVATSYNNLATLYMCQGKYKKAIKLHIKSLQIRKSILGDEHPDTAIGYYNFAEIYVQQKRYELALIYYFKAYRVFTSKFGPHHPNTILAFENMRFVYEVWRDDGDFELWLNKKSRESQC